MFEGVDAVGVNVTVAPEQTVPVGLAAIETVAGAVGTTVTTPEFTVPVDQQPVALL